VKLYSAVQDRDVHFHILEKRTQSRVKQHMSVSEEETRAESSEIRKGYEVEPGRFVVIEQPELDALKPKESRAIQISRFLPSSAITHEWYERPYYLMPEQQPTPYLALVEALKKQDVQGVVRSARPVSRAHFARRRAIFPDQMKYSREVLPSENCRCRRFLIQPRAANAENSWRRSKAHLNPRRYDELQSLMKFIEAAGKSRAFPRLNRIAIRR
jgi:Ku protein